MSAPLNTTSSHDRSQLTGRIGKRSRAGGRTPPVDAVVSDSIAAVDLFCGAGGLTYGMVQSGIPVVEGVDVDTSCRHAYEFNNGSKFVNKSVLDYSTSDIQEAVGKAKIKVLVGCAPNSLASRQSILNYQAK